MGKPPECLVAHTCGDAPEWARYAFPFPTPPHTHAHTRTHTHAHARTYTRTHTRTHAHTHTHAHARTRTRTRTRTHPRVVLCCSLLNLPPLLVCGQGLAASLQATLNRTVSLESLVCSQVRCWAQGVHGGDGGLTTATTTSLQNGLLSFGWEGAYIWAGGGGGGG